MLQNVIFLVFFSGNHPFHFTRHFSEQIYIRKKKEEEGTKNSIGS